MDGIFRGYYSNTKSVPCKHLQSIFKQLLTELAIQKNCSDIASLRLPAINPPTFEIFSIPNLEITLPNLKHTRTKISMDSYINYIKEINNKNTMLIFTDGSAINNPGPTGAGAVIKVNGPTSTPIT